MSDRLFITEQIQDTPSDEAKAAWLNFCNTIQMSLPVQAFQTWFSPIQPLRFENKTMTIKVPSRFYYDWIEGHYASHVEKALNDSLGDGTKLIYSASKNNGHTIPEKPLPITVSDMPAAAEEKEVDISSTNKSNIINLNDRYLFSNFIEGPQNSFARAACLAVGKAPGKTRYNPLLIYGGVGLGKTHLLQAIGNEARKTSNSISINYISSDVFTKEFVDAIQRDKRDSFFKRYTSVDLLLLDDVQFLVGREGTQREFFNIFNDLYQDSKQIVLTSDKPPRDLDGLDERLVSRIGWGLVCDIGPPDFDTRVAIVKKFSSEENIDLSNDVCNFIAENFTKNVRDLQGAVLRLIAHSSLTNSEISLPQARKLLTDLVKTKNIPIMMETVHQVVSNHFDVKPDLLISKTRVQPIATARMIAMALSIRLCGLSLKQVGEYFGRRDHTTVLHAKKSVESWESKDPELSATIKRLIRSIESESI